MASLLSSPNSAMILADRGPSTTDSAIIPEHCCAEPLRQVATIVSPRDIPPITAGDASSVVRYPPTVIARQDSVNDTSSTIVPEAEHAERVADGWQEDTKGVLKFASVFSAIVASFITASYQILSPDFGGPLPSIVCVYIMWLLSLVLSIMSALFATLTGDWTRRYIQLPQYSSPSRNRAHTRSPLFPDFMRRAVAMTVTIMHLSVFLFLVGLVIFFFTINKIVAIFVTVIIGPFGVVYLTLTFHACIDRNFPYRTPLALSGM